MHSSYEGLPGRVRVNAMPRRRVLKKVKAAVRINSHGGTLVMTESGALYASGVRKGYVMISANVIDQVRAIHRVGAITKEELDAYIVAAEAKRDRAVKQYAAGQLEEGAEALGIKLTKRQQAAVEAAFS